MHLHVFNDPHGFILNQTVERFARMVSLDRHLFINLNNRTIYRDERVVYLDHSITAFKKIIRSLNQVRSVRFYPFDSVAAVFWNELKKRFPNLPVSWVFWGYEVYHRPDLKGNDSHAPGLLRQTLKPLIRVLKKLAHRPVFDAALLNEGYRDIQFFYSFLPEDFEQARKNFPSLDQAIYRPFSFLSLNDFIKDNVPVRNRSMEIMIGHSASPSLYHEEIFERLAMLSLNHAFLIPLEYGSVTYADKVGRNAVRLLRTEISFIGNRMTLADYNRRISHAGFAIFNFRWQEGLGNIVFLVWNGTKVFLRNNSSVYRQFHNWGIRVFSIEEELNTETLSTLLDTATANRNREILESLFSEDQIRQYWQPLIYPETPA